ncbi:Yng1p KNAG_0L01890 [Huiozyma naganishii CBS 8797]|uniref:Zinc finger PHD-type domain-containing protein n=1 Tax=Huiozyma naganishii (strain ATCC MYA-139 / BCRC 22969 / CBS 8797 / KCTC 17520 / NBRC 10181 / NCYC 3082 / Yp74L-3) TaxID=1071383 RepID=J7RSB6_HUIN7|nr:hypothetical protein KNAG_0L01890 [Kazachstania naganishii CBS 8797]CCK72808.1 hypothetical protein KNAG_0L01890 [Kazachstania naganishii CBS 8797]
MASIDPRCEFLGTLDHFVCDLVRELWVRRDDPRAVRSAQLQELVSGQQRALLAQRDQLVLQQLVREQYRGGTGKVVPVQAAAEEEAAMALAPAVAAPTEPTYCFCGGVSYGDMIACDNLQCPLTWFHYGCVGITGESPSGKWYCSVECEKAAEGSAPAPKKKKSRRKGW